MIDIIERRAIVERILRAARDPDPGVGRRALYNALEDARQEGGKECSILLAATVMEHLGGKVAVSNDALASVNTESGGMTYASRMDGIVIEAVHELTPEQLHALALAHKPGDQVTKVFMPDEPDTAAPSADYPAANLTETESEARQRICAAVRMLISRHYMGEVEARGPAFHSTVFGELLAFALGLERDAEADPLPIAAWLERFMADMMPRVEWHQHRSKRLAGQRQLQPLASPSTLQ